MRRIWASLLVVFLLGSGLAAQEEPAVRVTDSYGRQILLPEYPDRIVSLAPNITETLFALGKGDLVVGRTDYCDWPAEVAGVPSVGTILQPNIERLVALEPDVVIASSHLSKEVDEKLRKLGIPVAVFNYPESFEGTYETILQVARVVGAVQKAEDLIDGIEQVVLTVMSAVSGLPRPRVYYVISYGQFGDYTAGKGTFIDTLIQIAGGVNVASDVEGWQYSAERLLEKDPDIIICSKYYNTKQGFMKTPPYTQLTAVKEGRVFEIDNNLVDRQGPRIGEGLMALARIIHPEAFEE
ncbi:ABC transporter substrate-binding protein [Spirochaeta thermophila]|uniref:Fe/B12 periplasmic-binding domain-containing protein n=1 Tax=Winmispira thermophila (strain ATCC 49972 / DSM 6192 / RI 19.B1) TaxID=665571 RepID=E0RR62_WINT6|nr:ABC transporter substrate-binding protein [Spirochaeta thermophila]ADN03039.1 hypothetical protein STHERM_c21080 [Spirochaeta thermophila DSM 6192]